MKMNTRIFLVIILFFGVLCPFTGNGQNKEEEAKPDRLTALFPSFSYHWPGGDLANRFGNSSSIGPGFLLKTTGNWVWWADANFLFGNRMREDSLLQNLLTSEGGIINEEGYFAGVSLFERGFFTSGKAGKLIPVFGSNKNSGLLILAGAGYLQHKIRIQVKENSVPQLRGDYLKGYDRLTDGFMTTQFIGYMYVGESKLANFFAGIEIIESWTQNRRSMDFDTMRRDDRKRFDMLTGFKVGWIIPLRKRMPKDYYYF